MSDAPWTIESLARFFRMTDDADLHGCELIWWRANEPQYEPFTLLINCNDLFYWACADAEEVTPERLDVLDQSLADVCEFHERWRRAVKSASEGHGREEPYVATEIGLLLYCARVRGMRPQGAYYDQFPPGVDTLFDAAGPARGGKDDTPRRAWGGGG